MLIASKPLFATTGGWITLCTLILSITAVMAAALKLGSKLNKIAETPGKLDEVIHELHALGDKVDQNAQTDNQWKLNHVTFEHGTFRDGSGRRRDQR